jgi:benzoyl-CoA reductase subunit A
MDCVVGIDLGSTTTKAVVLEPPGRVLGRGITNTRNNYQVACAVARHEAFVVAARFTLLREAAAAARPAVDLAALAALERGFRREQYVEQLRRLILAMDEALRHPAFAERAATLRPAVAAITAHLLAEAPALFAADARLKSDFFRDIAQARFTKAAEEVAAARNAPFEWLVGCFDKAILAVDNAAPDWSFAPLVHAALAQDRATRAPREAAALSAIVTQAAERPLAERYTVGTGYGRSTLPFPREQIRSEILCHGLGAHAMFPATRTVLDIGGQDTKAIQVDGEGIVTSFQMNDRCAAGCGRYLGYIADEMNLGLHELGPLAQQSRLPVKISSTCTVFAGAEIRDRLTLGQRREDILAGLHRAIILRAMSLLARSGGVADEFTFTGGVARNPAAVAALRQLVAEHYGGRTLNISPDSIFTGALGAALFAARACAAPTGVA